MIADCTTSGVVMTRNDATTASASTPSEMRDRSTTRVDEERDEEHHSRARDDPRAARDRAPTVHRQRHARDQQQPGGDGQEADDALHPVDAVPHRGQLRPVEQDELQLVPARELAGEVRRHLLQGLLDLVVRRGEIQDDGAGLAIDEHPVRVRQREVEHGAERTRCRRPVPRCVARNGSATWRLVPARRESWRTITLASSACTSSWSSSRFAVSVNLEVWRKFRSSHQPVLAVTSPIPPMTSKIVAPISRSLRRSLTLCSFVRYSPITPVPLTHRVLWLSRCSRQRADQIPYAPAHARR